LKAIKEYVKLFWEHSMLSGKTVSTMEGKWL